MTLLRIAALAAGAAAACAALANPFVAKPGVREFTGEMIVRPVPASTWISQGVASEEAIARTNRAFARISSNTKRTISATGEAVIRVPAGKTENSFNKELMATGLFQYAEPNWRVYYLGAPNDPGFSKQWHHQVMRSAKGWDLHTGRNTVVVGVVDSGVDLDHPDLQKNLLPGYNSMERKRQVDGGLVDDYYGHGTHVAGCAAALGNNSVAVAGMGWDMKVLPIRIADGSGNITMDSIFEGARWAADNGATAINCSLVGAEMQAAQTTGAYARTKGASLLFAAGNDQEDLAGFDWPDVIVVGASTINDQRAGFSAYGRAVDFFSPGENIYATGMGGGTETMSGTSMATPIAAGLYCLIKSYNPRLTPQQIEQVMNRSCVKIGPDTIFGFGRLDVQNAMLETQKTLTVRQDIAATAVALSSGALAGGSVASLGAVDSNNYSVRSARFALGQISAATVDFTIPNSSKAMVVAPTVVMTSSRTSRPVTGTWFLWNYATRKFDTVGTYSVASSGATANRREFSKDGFKNYMSSTGQVKLMLRGHTADSRLTGSAESFTMHLNRVALSVDFLQ